jgi:hypothetical protein
MTEEKLNLLKFASRGMTEASASASKIVRCQMAKADSLGITFYGIPDNVGCHSRILPSATLRNSPEYSTSGDSRGTEPII